MPNKPLGKLDHIGIAVRSLAEARPFFEDVLGATFLFEAESPQAGYKLQEFDLNGLTLELLEPLGGDSFLHKFLRNEVRGCTISPSVYPTPGKKSLNSNRRACELSTRPNGHRSRTRHSFPRARLMAF